MIKSYSYKGLTWLDAGSPTPKEVSSLVEKYRLHPLVGEELLVPTRKPKIDIYDSYLFLVLHIPIRRNGSGKKVIEEKEIDFIIGSDFIITTHAGTVSPLHNLGKSFETNAVLEKGGIASYVGNHAGIIFYHIMKRLYDQMRQDLEDMRDDLNRAEKNIFEGNERKMVQALSELSREIIDFKQTARLHKEVLESFSAVPQDFFGSDFAHFIEDIRQTYASIHELIGVNKELLTDLRETNDSLLSTKQNEHMKFFTILAFVTFPLALLLDIFSLPTSHTPIIGSPYDWEIITGGVIVLAITMFAYFKDKGWL